MGWVFIGRLGRFLKIFLHKLLLHHVSGFYKCSWMAAKMGCKLWWLWAVASGRERERSEICWLWSVA